MTEATVANQARQGLDIELTATYMILDATLEKDTKAKATTFRRKVVELEVELQQALKTKAVGTPRSEASGFVSNDVWDFVLMEYLSCTR
ncbi:hypothetical protein ACLOJK_026350 [Asimina triloba]